VARPNTNLDLQYAISDELPLGPTSPDNLTNSDPSCRKHEEDVSSRRPHVVGVHSSFVRGNRQSLVRYGVLGLPRLTGSAKRGLPARWRIEDSYHVRVHHDVASHYEPHRAFCCAEGQNLAAIKWRGTPT